MQDANEMECLIFENAIKYILLGKVTKSGVSDANNKLIITIFQMWGHIDPIRSGIGLRAKRGLALKYSALKIIMLIVNTNEKLFNSVTPCFTRTVKLTPRVHTNFPC